MFAAAAAGASHPAVAALLGLGAAALAGVVVAMAWNVHVRQIRLAEQLARRQFIVTADAGAAGGAANGRASPQSAVEQARDAAATTARMAAVEHATGTATAKAVLPLVIDGPETVVTGEQARYHVRPSATGMGVLWAVGGGSVSQSPDPGHPDELLLIADRPGSLIITVRVREGMAERRATKPITAVADVTAPAPPFTLRLFLHGWGLAAIAVLIVGFAGALDALGNFTSADFIALAAPLAALLGVVALARGSADPAGPAGGPRSSKGTAARRP